MAILVSGGAGYIGSHTCIELLNAGYDIVVADNYYNASPVVLDRVKQITGKDFRFYKADMTRREDVEKIFSECPDITAVIQFAAYKAVGESVSKPIEYYYNNLNCTLVILDVMRHHDCHNFVFSSSATVYGDPASVPITEDFPVGATTNPYGTTKAFTERILQDVCKADPSLNVALLRYFNPIGAHKSGLIGEDPNGIPNNLMPYIAKVAVGKLEKVHVFGNDYPTPDGTGPCVRHPQAGDRLRPLHLQSGHRQGLQRAGCHPRLLQGLRQGDPLRHRSPPPRRYRRVLRRPHQGQERAGLGGRVRHRGNVRRQLELAEEQPRWLPYREVTCKKRSTAYSRLRGCGAFFVSIFSIDIRCQLAYTTFVNTD